MINPREQFQKSPWAKGWLDVVDSTQFEQAATTALAQLQIELANAPDMGTAAAFHQRAEGAKHFLKILMSLTAPATERKIALGGNLNHRA